jgi:hypothetical protein
MSIFSPQNQAAERENDQSSPIIHCQFSFRFSGVESGLDFILSHFREYLFPRKVMTKTTVDSKIGQCEVIDRGHTMRYFKEASGLDCRIAAFGMGQKNPDLVFVDLDRRNFVSDRAFKMVLTKTLKRIKERIGGHPTVLWSGRGYHVIQPMACQVNLDNVKELAALTDRPNDAFLQFAERYLSNGRCDDGNHPAMKSCLLRIPRTLNFRCTEEGLDPEVKIIQKWDGFRPDYRLLLGHFYAHLVGVNGHHHKERKSSHFTNMTPGQDYGAIPWIEKLLQTPIDDFRKHARDLILVPYLVVRRGMTDEAQISDTIMQWADKCAALKRLEPSRHEFNKRIHSRIYEVVQDRIPPMRFETLKEKNPGLYDKLQHR